MSVTTSTSADRNGEAWGLRAQDWSEVETQQRPTYEEAVRAIASARARRSSTSAAAAAPSCALAADAGATVCGLDASHELLELARERVPEADLAQGDLQQLPYVDDSFDAVLGFNSFFFADDMIAALREAGRVAKPGAPVVIQVWGRPEAFDAAPDEGRARALHAAAAAGRDRPDRAVAPGRARAARRRGGAHARPRVRPHAGPTSSPTRPSSCGR